MLYFRGTTVSLEKSGDGSVSAGSHPVSAGCNAVSAGLAPCR